MSRLDRALSAFSALSQCAAALVDYRASRPLLEENAYLREGLRQERERADRLEAELRALRGKE